MAFSEEIKIEALKNRRIRFAEISILYTSRLGEIKLNPWRDGFYNLYFSGEEALFGNGTRRDRHSHLEPGGDCWARHWSTWRDRLTPSTASSWWTTAARMIPPLLATRAGAQVITLAAQRRVCRGGKPRNSRGGRQRMDRHPQQRRQPGAGLAGTSDGVSWNRATPGLRQASCLDAQTPERIDGSFDAVCRGGCAWRCGHGRLDSPAVEPA